MSKLKQKLHISKRTVAYIALILFILSLIPVVAMSFYSTPAFDDYNFGRETHIAFSESGTAASFFSGAVNCVKQTYNSWQGFYSATFIAAIQPFNANVNLYFVSNLTVIFVFLLSGFYILRVVLKYYLNFEKYDRIIISCLIMTLTLQFMPSIAEGIYWMDGSLSVLFTGVFIIIYALALRINKLRKKASIIWRAILMFVLLIIMSGMVPLSFLTYMLINVIGLVYFGKNKNKRMVAILSAFSAIIIAGFTISMIAPGNSVRMSTDPGFASWSIPKSILFAIYSSIEYFGDWTTLCVVAVLALILPIVYKNLKNSQYSFKHPFIMLILSYGVYSARFSVQLAAGGYLGAPRQFNEYYIGYIWLIFINAFYITGWLAKKNANKKIFDFECIYNGLNKYSLVCCLAIAVVFAAGCISYGPTHLASTTTLKSLITGEAAQYKQEMTDRVKLYEDPNIKNVEVEPLSVCPEAFMADSLGYSPDDPGYWNDSVEKYYNKESIVLKQINE